MNELPQIQLDHVNIPAQRPEWLADWYAENFGFQSRDGFVYGIGTLLVFHKGKPLDYQGKTHFGFRSNSREQVTTWADKFSVKLDQDETYCGFQTSDPEGNFFKVYWEQV